MTQQEVNQYIRMVFKEVYSDTGLYRLANRNKKELKFFFGVTFIACLGLSTLGSDWWIAYWSFLFIGTIFILGIEHFWIGTRLKKIQNRLYQKGIKASLPYVLYVCEDIIPK
jgi:hypothetical protein